MLSIQTFTFRPLAPKLFKVSPLTSSFIGVTVVFGERRAVLAFSRISLAVVGILRDAVTARLMTVSYTKSKVFFIRERGDGQSA